MLKDLIDKIKNWALVLKLWALPNFFHVLVGMYLVKGHAFGVRDIYLFVQVFSVYGLLMYTGLYSINNYFDREKDAKNLYKRNRILPKNILKPTHVLLVSSILITLSLIFGFYYFKSLIYFQLYFIFVNLLYTLGLKKLNSLLASLVATTTSIARVSLGIILAGGSILKFWDALILVWFLLYLVVTYKLEYSDPNFSNGTVPVVRKLVIVVIIAATTSLLIHREYFPLLYLFYYLPWLILSSLNPKFKQFYTKALNT